MSSAVTIRPVESKKDKNAFVDFAWEVYKDDPAWIPPLKDEVHGLITPGKNPWFEHARAQLWLAKEISARPLRNRGGSIADAETVVYTRRQSKPTTLLAPVPGQLFHDLSQRQLRRLAPL